MSITSLPDYSAEDVLLELQNTNGVIEAFALMLDEANNNALGKAHLVSFLYMVHNQQQSLLAQLAQGLHGKPLTHESRVN
ncbi:MAG: hypothetical protein PHE38_10995 [Alishewanella agri]|jgi:hypothetical protein|nr:hypothetical protein [Alishewanella agri]